ncbi:hypothetical protein D3C77_671260 [compost metagenome]
MWRQRDQRSGEDVGDQHVGLHGRHVLGQVQGKFLVGDAVAPGVVAGGFQGLDVDIGTNCFASAEQQGGNCQNP